MTELETAKKLLRGVEWGPEPWLPNGGSCPWCCQSIKDGHDESCDLAHWLDQYDVYKRQQIT